MSHVEHVIMRTYIHIMSMNIQLAAARRHRCSPCHNVVCACVPKPEGLYLLACFRETEDENPWTDFREVIDGDGCIACVPPTTTRGWRCFSRRHQVPKPLNPLLPSGCLAGATTTNSLTGAGQSAAEQSNSHHRSPGWRLLAAPITLPS